jgi:hypothetical protein
LAEWKLERERMDEDESTRGIMKGRKEGCFPTTFHPELFTIMCKGLLRIV